MDHIASSLSLSLSLSFSYALLFFYRTVDSPKRSAKIIGKLPLASAASRCSAFIRDLCGSVIPHTDNPYMRTRRDRYIYISGLINNAERTKKNNSRSVAVAHGRRNNIPHAYKAEERAMKSRAEELGTLRIFSSTRFIGHLSDRQFIRLGNFHIPRILNTRRSVSAECRRHACRNTYVCSYV